MKNVRENVFSQPRLDAIGFNPILEEIYQIFYTTMFP